jgi:hypothetical protein
MRPRKCIVPNHNRPTPQRGQGSVREARAENGIGGRGKDQRQHHRGSYSFHNEQT